MARAMRHAADAEAISSVTRPCSVCEFDYPKDHRHFNMSSTVDGTLYSMCKRCDNLKGWFRDEVVKRQLPYDRTVEGLRKYVKDNNIILDRWVPPTETPGFFDV